jgi:ribosomal protein L39E
MSKIKTARTKATLGKMIKRNRRMPLFVVAKTKRRVTQNRMRRDWRHEKMDLKED